MRCAMEDEVAALIVKIIAAFREENVNARRFTCIATIKSAAGAAS